MDFFLLTGAVKSNWNKFIGNHIGVMPEEIWMDINWRDRRIGSFLQSS